VLNCHPKELILRLSSFRMNGFLALLDLSRVFEDGAQSELDK
jgi:hypothetical protein